MALALLSTKLHAPAPAAHLVIRPRLLELLELGSRARIILVSAPAGAGKSTLLGSWLAARARPTAWLSLDKNDNDLEHFLFYLISTLQQIEPGIGAGLQDILQAQSSVTAEPLIIRLINDISRLDHELLLVLDDYHLLSSQRIHDAVDFLLDHLPSQLRLVIATRSDPPLALARLRVNGQVLEIRADDLRFSIGETHTFLNDRFGLELSNAAIASLEERTEGWIAGLQLAALSLEGRSDKEGFVRRFAGSHRYLVDYLMDEVLERQTPEARRFLQRTSILERFTALLCQAVSEQPDSSTILRQLVDANLFVIALDDERTWYRYHHLFAEFLRHRLAEAEAGCIPELHRRASAWFEDQGWRDEAIHHALAANDLERAGHLVEDIAFSLEVSSDNTQLINYVSQFPLEMLASLPKLSIYFGWALVNTGRTALLSAALPVIERSASHAEQPHVVAACVLALQAFQRLWQMDFAGGVRRCQDAIAVLNRGGAQPGTDEERWLLTAANNLISYCYLHSDLAQADRTYPGARALSRRLGNHIGAANDFARHGWVKHQLGQSRQALGIFREGLRALESWNVEGGRVMNVGELHLNLSRLLYEWNRLDEADIHLRQAIEFNQRSQFPPVLALEYEIAFHLHLAHERTEGAVSMLGKLDSLLAEVHPGNSLYAQLFGVMAQHLRLHLASSVSGFSHLLDDVRAWVEARHLEPGDTFDYPYEGSYVVLVRLLLAQGRAVESLPLLERLVQAARASGRTRDLICYLNLQALAEHKLGREAASRAALQRALALAEPEGYCRSFVDEGSVLHTLLERFATRRSTPYILRLLAAFPAPSREASAVPSTLEARARATREPSWPSALNERERVVLRLLAAGHSNKGIAKELGLSPNTVRWYVSSLLGKLGVASRLEAVSRARESGLL